MKNIKTPMRRCVGCMTSKPKNELVRIVAADGGVKPDITGRANGRGVYLCKNADCLEKALKKNAVTRGLNMNGLNDSEKDKLRTEFADFFSGTEVSA